ncbi:BCCT family transporter [Streptomyces sp. NPDC059637]|uniref:BCCT family transporter n=1 Tax=Streptomyces sp. NPDC059637 TaxID=3347752 RepID=UPI00368A25F0
MSTPGTAPGGDPRAAGEPVAEPLPGAGPQPRTLPPDRVVFGVGTLLTAALVAWGVFAPEHLDSVAGAALDWTLHSFAWLFVSAADLFLVLALVLAATRFGRIRLGRDDEVPEFNAVSWTAMMFSAGMGIGLMFYGVAEPLTHFSDPPPASGQEPLSEGAARSAMEYTLFHWTLHPWAIYAVAGLALAYATFRKGRGNNMSSAFVGLLGRKRTEGAPGRAIDLLAIFATVFGSATSLGLGALQMAAGLELVAGVGAGKWLELIIIAALTLAFVVSAVSGVHRGVKWLSTTNMALAVFLIAFVFVVGPTVYVLDVLPASVGGYLNNLIPMASATGAFSDPGWLGGWTVFYWAWWLSWAPFVGTFIARISRGRTVREFVVGVLLVPSGASAVWFAVLGGSAIRLQDRGDADLVGALGKGQEAALFGLLEALPWYTLTGMVCIVLVALYFVSGADAASLVLGSLSSRGALQPRRGLVVTWGVLIGAVAAVLLLAGGLEALQTATILVALPFVLVMLGLCASLVKELREDPALGAERRRALRGIRDAVRAEVGEAMAEYTAAHPHHRRLRRAARSARGAGVPGDESDPGDGSGSGEQSGPGGGKP